MTGSTGVPGAEYEVADDALSRQVGGETVIIDLATEEYFGLNAVGTLLWRGLEEGRPLPAVLDQVVERFEVDRDRAEADLTGLLAALVEAGLVRPRASAVP